MGNLFAQQIEAVLGDPHSFIRAQRRCHMLHHAFMQFPRHRRPGAEEITQQACDSDENRTGDGGNQIFDGAQFTEQDK